MMFNNCSIIVAKEVYVYVTENNLTSMTGRNMRGFLKKTFLLLGMFL